MRLHAENPHGRLRDWNASDWNCAAFALPEIEPAEAIKTKLAAFKDGFSDGFNHSLQGEFGLVLTPTSQAFYAPNYFVVGDHAIIEGVTDSTLALMSGM